ncbi:MAG: RNA methyltransferase [Candidatus Sungbacteria bacterium]|nr:RNA methyltransferase [Candidatus Sungbacteria bacterium]
MSRQNNNSRKDFYIVCHNIRSRENVGSVFRTSDAFGVSKIYLTGYTPAPPHEKISKTALGAERWVAWEKRTSVSQLLKELKKKRVQIVALEQSPQSVALNKLKPHFPMALVVGNEVKGLPRSLVKAADKAVEIPMSGKKESLNVAVAFGIAAYQIHRFRD